MSGRGNTADAAPLALRLRVEADEWEAGEAVAPLLVEAAEAIELLAAELVLGRAALEAAEARAERLLPIVEEVAEGGDLAANGRRMIRPSLANEARDALAADRQDSAA